MLGFGGASQGLGVREGVGGKGDVDGGTAGRASHHGRREGKQRRKQTHGASYHLAAHAEAVAAEQQPQQQAVLECQF